MERTLRFFTPDPDDSSYWQQRAYRSMIPATQAQMQARRERAKALLRDTLADARQRRLEGIQRPAKRLFYDIAMGKAESLRAELLGVAS